jgi:8-oxo-dGTP diphosphatase
MIKVTAAVIEKDGKILIGRRKRSDRMGGKWEFPGGKLGLGETPEACLKRELKEELNIETEIGDFICSAKFTYMLVPLELLVYKARYLSGELKALDHDELVWAAPNELGRYDFVKADVTVVKKLMKDIYNVE